MLETEFKSLYKAAENLLNNDINAQQAIVLRARNVIYTFADHDIQSGNIKEEQQMEELLLQNNNTEITELVCMWKDGTLDVPSWHLRSALVKMNPANKKTKILLAGATGYLVKTFEEMG